MTFRSCALFGLKVILNTFGANCANKENVQILERVCHVIESHMVCTMVMGNTAMMDLMMQQQQNLHSSVQSSISVWRNREYDAMLYQLQSLNNKVLPLIHGVVTCKSVPDANLTWAIKLTNRLFNSWSLIQLCYANEGSECCNHDNNVLIQGSAEFIPVMFSLPSLESFLKDGSPDSTVDLLQCFTFIKLIFNNAISNNHFNNKYQQQMGILLTAVQAIQSLLHSSNLAKEKLNHVFEFGLDLDLLRVYAWLLGISYF